MTKIKGFTLIEVMIVVAIVAILATIAIPSYQRHVMQARRAEAREAVLRVASLQERLFFSRNGYTASLNDLGFTNDLTQRRLYQLAIRNAPTCTSGSNQFPCYTVFARPTAASPQQNDTDCWEFSVDQTGRTQSLRKDMTTSTDECW